MESWYNIGLLKVFADSEEYNSKYKSNKSDRWLDDVDKHLFLSWAS